MIRARIKIFMEVKMAHAIGHKPAPDIGWGTKISAVCVGAAGLLPER